MSTPATSRDYQGRFAPTPSGPLHFGSLVAALGSFLEARCHGGRWMLRIDDLDTPRVQPGATDAILRCLDRHGFEWDGPVVFQSQRRDAYHAALHRLRQRGLVYPCSCSRGDIARDARQGMEGPVYAGTCRDGMGAGMGTGLRARAWRLRCAGVCVELDDPVVGPQHIDLDSQLGDFVLYRSDGVYAFHLASAVDDADYGMTDIVRGADLLPSSLRQIHLLRCLGLTPPRYAHLPVATDDTGQKLSKQSHAPALQEDFPQAGLLRALSFLGQSPAQELYQAALSTVWQWARENWRLSHVRGRVQRDSGEPSLASSTRSGGNA